MKILPNGIAVVEGDHWLSKWVEECGRLTHDVTVYAHILPLIPEGGVVVDAGAAIGDHTVAYADKVGPTGRVLAFEPNPVAMECLIYNTRQYPQVSTFHVGLSNAPGHAGVNHDSGGNLGAASLDYVRHGSVPLDSLDRIVRSEGLPRLDLIKADVEGFELYLLQGAVRTICRFRPILIVEINLGCLRRVGLEAEDVLGFIGALNYDVAPLTPDYSLEQYDVICRPN